ncbi:PEP-CTERM sorting domain-containing protein [Parvularcula lutaonensis]|uniref:PEP-CTERM sorting domain-containing protein n=1 Tax=Parvularcula lutaonensis TaxID=491923 RepID=A0ABV7MBE3_9PROT|nr:PEP-CTERM sorting domain-containing protein [Parvularcula lutaonensis]
MKKLFSLAAASIAALSLGTANAALLDLTKHAVGPGSDTNANGINERNGVPQNNTLNPFEIRIGQVIVTIEGFPGATNADENSQPGPHCQPGGMFACDSDGLGIGNDEVSTKGNQMVKVSFSVPVIVTELFYLDLFSDPNVSTPTLAQTESAIAELFTGTTSIGSWETFATTQRGTSRGFESELLGGVGGVTSIMFSPGAGADDSDGDFALAGITFRPEDGTLVPVPGALPLFLAGLGGLAAARRRRKA